MTAPGVMKFEDHRLLECERLLKSDSPMFLRVPGVAADQVSVAAQQARLFALCLRAMALSVGRGMLQIGTTDARATEPISIPPLVLAGRVPPNAAVISLDASLLGNVVCWPEFHNGVAAGLSYTGNLLTISRTWITSARPVDLTDAHAGLLLGLGLRGLLPALAQTDLFGYLLKKHELTQIALLLGMSAARAGTMDQAVYRMLSLHVPALLPPAATDVEILPLVQTAAVAGVGLLFMNTCHRRMSEVLLQELKRCGLPGSPERADREGYALAAGASLGLVALGRGDSAPGLSTLHIGDCMIKLIGGGRTEETSGTCDTLFSDGLLNGDVCGPAAAVGLALLYIGTESETVASRVALPTTQFLLGRVSPFMMLLCTLTRNLIMWNQVLPSREWVLSNVSDVVLKRHTPSPRDDIVARDVELLNIAYANIVAGACLALGLRYASTGNKMAVETLSQFALEFAKPGDLKQLTETQQTCIAVCITALGMVMAGSGDLPTLQLMRTFHRRLATEVLYGHHMAVNMALGLLFLGQCDGSLSTDFSTTALLLLSFYPRYPLHPTENRFHLQALRHLYSVRTNNTRTQTASDQPSVAPITPSVPVPSAEPVDDLEMLLAASGVSRKSHEEKSLSGSDRTAALRALATKMGCDLVAELLV